jgi:hypothetical protein
MSRRAADRALGVTEIEHLGSKRDRPARGDESAGSKDPDGLVTPICGRTNRALPVIPQETPKHVVNLGAVARGSVSIWHREVMAHE